MDNFVAYVLPTQPDKQCPVVLCEYSKFQIKWNSYFSIRLDLKRAQLFRIFVYLLI